MNPESTHPYRELDPEKAEEQARAVQTERDRILEIEKEELTSPLLGRENRSRRDFAGEASSLELILSNKEDRVEGYQKFRNLDERMLARRLTQLRSESAKLKEQIRGLPEDSKNLELFKARHELELTRGGVLQDIDSVERLLEFERRWHDITKEGKIDDQLKQLHNRRQQLQLEYDELIQETPSIEKASGQGIESRKYETIENAARELVDIDEQLLIGNRLKRERGAQLEE